MFWFVCLTTLTAMASLPLYRYLAPFIRTRSRRLCDNFAHHRLLRAICAYTFSSSASNEQGGRKRGSFKRIYTRTGDNGTSALFTGERKNKDDCFFEALGTTDELTSAIGLAREFVGNSTVRDELEQIQCILQDLQGTIATPKTSATEFQLRKTKWNVNHLVDLEKWIDNHSETLPPLRSFILPSGGKASSCLHLARSICRRAERRLVPLLDEGLELPVLQYLNRLSSYLFTVARLCCQEDGFQETIYRRPRQQDDIPEDGNKID